MWRHVSHTDLTLDFIQCAGFFWGWGEVVNEDDPFESGDILALIAFIGGQPLIRCGCFLFLIYTGLDGKEVTWIIVEGRFVFWVKSASARG